MKHYKSPSRNAGFTLVELAIVLVIIGLILGMAFKGKDLIDGAKVKSAEASINKVVSAINTYYERYGAYPGDGCSAAPTLGSVHAVCSGTRNGLLDTAIEGTSSLIQLQNAKLLTNTDLHSPFGTNWTVVQGVNGTGNTSTGYAYLTVGTLGTASADERLVCAIDQQFDDGVQAAGTVRTTGGTGYAVGTDCWALTSTAAIAVQILP